MDNCPSFYSNNLSQKQPLIVGSNVSKTESKLNFDKDKNVFDGHFILGWHNKFGALVQSFRLWVQCLEFWDIQNMLWQYYGCQLLTVLYFRACVLTEVI